MVAHRTGTNPIEIGEPGTKVKITVIKNVSENDERNSHNLK